MANVQWTWRETWPVDAVPHSQLLQVAVFRWKVRIHSCSYFLDFLYMQTIWNSRLVSLFIDKKMPSSSSSSSSSKPPPSSKLLVYWSTTTSNNNSREMKLKFSPKLKHLWPPSFEQLHWQLPEHNTRQQKRKAVSKLPDRDEGTKEWNVGQEQATYVGSLRWNPASAASNLARKE